ncbi:MAG TPA: DUF222 domain-containing protein, partial [Microbacterium sp.]|uniref:DUF222 domain-containing protein n=1 Tax=Microbacterium sp. TaxID=51671 RepID=UPI002B470144
MGTFGGIVDQQVRVLVGLLGEVAVADAAPVIVGLGDESVVGVITAATDAIRELEALRVLATGVAARRSGRDAGHGGLAQRLGHRNAVSLVQDLTGVSKAQAGRVTRLGQALVETALPDVGDATRPDVERPPNVDGGPAPDPGADAGRDAPAEGVPVRPWHACLGDAFTTGRISVDQQSAIRRGLGDPPAPAGTPGQPPSPDADMLAAWALAAQQLIDEASRRTVEDLAAAARIIRDRLDPDGAARRFRERFEARSFRVWTDTDGIRHGSVRFDDTGAAWATAILDAALRPRRGGPRFVDPAEHTAAEQLAADPRTNEQLAYDLLLDLLHSGAVADAAHVFGTRQAGIRIIITQTAHDDASAGKPAVAVIEDTRTTVPAAFAAQHACDTGHIACTLD